MAPSRHRADLLADDQHPSELLGGSERFIGREWVLTRMAEWLESDDSRPFLLVGQPGSGKSAVIAHLLESACNSTATRSASVQALLDSLGYLHFCRARDNRSSNPFRFIENLAVKLARIDDRFAQALLLQSVAAVQLENSIVVHGSASNVTGISIGSVQVGTSSPSLLFDQVIAKTIERSQMQSLVLVAIDGLDETIQSSRSSDMLDLVQHILDYGASLPLKLIVTARSNSVTIIDLLGEPTLDLSLDEPVGTDDVRSYVADVVSRMDYCDSRLIDKVAAGAKGNFLYARYQLAEFRRDPMTADPEALPTGLVGIYRAFIQRDIAPTRAGTSWTQRFRPILGLLSASFGSGLTARQIHEILDLPESIVADSLAICASFLRPSGSSSDPAYRLYHDSFREFLTTDDRFNVYPAESHKLVTKHYLDRGAVSWENTDTYALQYLVSHLQDSGQYRELIALAGADEFLDQQDRVAVRHELAIATLLAAVRAAVASNDFPSISKLALRSAKLQDEAAIISPLNILLVEDVESAVAATTPLPHDERVLWLLLIAREIHTQQSDDRSARNILSQIVSMKPTQLGNGAQSSAAVLLSQVYRAGEEFVDTLQDSLLNDWGRQHFVSLLVDYGQLQHAVRALPSFSDYEIWTRALTSVAEELIRKGNISEAVVLYREFVSVNEQSSWRPYPSIYEDNEEDVMANLFGGNAEADAKVRELLLPEAQTGRAEGVVCAKAALYYWQIGDGVTAELCLAAARRSASQTGGTGSAWIWLSLGETYLAINRVDDASDVLAEAKAVKAPLESLISSAPYYGDVHDDPQHRFCPQGLTLKLSQALARAGDTSASDELANELVSLESRDAVRALLASSNDLSGVDGASDNRLPRFERALVFANSLHYVDERIVELYRLAGKVVAGAGTTASSLLDQSHQLIQQLLIGAERKQAARIAQVMTALSDIAVAFLKNDMRDRSTATTGLVVELMRQLNPEWCKRFLATLIERLSNSGATSAILHLLEGTGLKPLGTSLYENVWESQIAYNLLSAGDASGANSVAKALKPRNHFHVLEVVEDIVIRQQYSEQLIESIPGDIAWQVSKMLRRTGNTASDNIRNRALENLRSSAAAIAERQAGPESAQETFAVAARAAIIANALGEMGLVAEADSAFSRSEQLYWSATDSWDMYRFVFAGVSFTADQEHDDRDEGNSGKALRHCSYIRALGFGSQGERALAVAEEADVHVQLMNATRKRDEARAEIAAALAYGGLFENSNAVLSQLSERQAQHFLQVVEAVIQGIEQRRAEIERVPEELHETILACFVSFDSTIRMCSLLPGRLYPLDAAAVAAIDELIELLTRYAREYLAR